VSGHIQKAKKKSHGLLTLTWPWATKGVIFGLYYFAFTAGDVEKGTKVVSGFV